MVCVSAPQLQSLMADAVDILAGGVGERAWAKIQKVTAKGRGQLAPGAGNVPESGLFKRQKREEVPG